MAISIVDSVAVNEQDDRFIPEQLLASGTRAEPFGLAVCHVPAPFEFAPREPLGLGAWVTAIMFPDRRPFRVHAQPIFGFRPGVVARQSEFAFGRVNFGFGPDARFVTRPRMAVVATAIPVVATIKAAVSLALATLTILTIWK